MLAWHPRGNSHAQVLGGFSEEDFLHLLARVLVLDALEYLFFDYTDSVTAMRERCNDRSADIETQVGEHRVVLEDLDDLRQ